MFSVNFFRTESSGIPWGLCFFQGLPPDRDTLLLVLLLKHGKVCLEAIDVLFRGNKIYKEFLLSWMGLAGIASIRFFLCTVTHLVEYVQEKIVLTEF